jgi:hypothetical protein
MAIRALAFSTKMFAKRQVTFRPRHNLCKPDAFVSIRSCHTSSKEIPVPDAVGTFIESSSRRKRWKAVRSTSGFAYLDREANATLEELPNAEKDLVYEGPFRDLLRNIKLVSLVSAASTCIGVPILAVLGTADIPTVARAAIAFTGFSACSDTFFCMNYS